MALIKCKECGSEHAKDAKACPTCGKPNALQEVQKKFLTVIVIGGIAALGAILVLDFMAYQAAGGGIFFKWLNQ